MVRFEDRHDAGRRLAGLLQSYAGQDGVVYALPRGGVPLGVEVARALRMPLELVITRKIGHPANPEYAICAIAETGELVCNEQERREVSAAWLRQRADEERAEAARRRQAYRRGHDTSAAGKLAIVVDDGIATGLTMLAAVRALRRQTPARLIVAVPVAPADAVRQLRQEADAVVVSDGDEFYLGSVGAYYRDFHQLSDADVVAELRSLTSPEATP